MIYFLEDDENIQKLVCYSLKKDGFEICGFEKPSEFFKAVKERLPELVILDIMLPEENGLSVLEKLRERPDTSKLPVIFLSAMDSEYDRVNGLDLGADDYIAKPFSVVELSSRIRAVLRRSSMLKTKQDVLCLGSLCMDTERHMVSVSGKEIELALKEYQLLYVLLSAGGAVCSRENLIASVWGEHYGESRTLDVHIRRLRMKLKEAGEYIQTVKGIGYKMKENHT